MPMNEPTRVKTIGFVRNVAWFVAALTILSGCDPLQGTDVSNEASTQAISETYREAVLASSPLGYWRLNETSIGQGAAEETGTGWTGSYDPNAITGVYGPLVPAFIDDAVPLAIGFQGSGPGVQFPNAVMIGADTPFVVEAWLQVPSQITTTSVTLVQLGGSGGSPPAVLSYNGSTQSLAWSVPDATGAANLLETSVASYLDQWIHIVVSADAAAGTAQRIFVNGMPVATGVLAGSGFAGYSGMEVGVLGTNDYILAAELALYSGANAQDSLVADHYHSAGY